MNGLTLSNVKFSQTNYNIYITNCSKDEASVEVLSNNRLFENVKTNIITSKGSINVISDSIVTATRVTDEYIFYNVVMGPIDESKQTQVAIFKAKDITDNNSMKVYIASASISKYNLIESLMELPNANLSMSNVNNKRCINK